ncbi:FAD-linked oxidase C-terminal domain-containing protein [Sinomonas sp. ASV486]|uniref:FAD-binding oxidoreductase n=1 Tax=Sinomonas sp. ASV486 TaxID=3051170 RepID=UPI0027DB281B|nr:FAD-linked oxidase C-terminal domain-containing protein [Sinomonas sp. ASV486]MDQ4489054.1 FAD-linked oxidase C-terminal domain-containing protein [Sinomonas sp. ASV486]
MHSTTADLMAALPEGRVLTAEASFGGYLHDEGEWAVFGTPLAVVRPESAEEVAAVVRWCVETGTPLVPRGAGTGLSGGANAIEGCVIVSFERMNAVLEVNEAERWARVQPGVVNDDLRAHVARHGLWYPPDPASSPWSTIGGNVATNAGGMCCVKYGVTRDYVLELEVVTGTGEITRLGHRTAKGVAGYDLAGLIVGSEGTLAVVTEIVVRLRPLPPAPITVAGMFDSLVDAGRAVALVAESGISPSVLELVDRHCLKAVDDWKHMGLSTDANAVLIGRTDAPGEQGAFEAAELARCFEEAGASVAAVSADEQESDALYAARRLAYPALERLGPVLTEDVCVPKAKVPEVLARIEEIAAAHSVLIANIAHAGDGNLHPLIITTPGDDAAKARAHEAFTEIIDAALAAGGTVSGEHGVGTLKLDGLRKELSPVSLALHHAVKNALDPHGILNPGRAIPPLGFVILQAREPY